MTKWNLSSHILRSLASVAFLGVLFIASCNENDDPKPAVEVSFATDIKVVGETGGPQTITVKLTKAAAKNGTIVLEASAGAASSLRFPEEVEIAQGTSFAQFTVYPVNNNLLDGTRAVTLTLTEPSTGFKLGTLTEMTIHVTDDESPAEANFSDASSSVAEDNATGIDVEIAISSPALGAGTVSVTLASDDATYGTHYTTDPAAVGSVITVPYIEGVSVVKFKVLPVDNNDVNNARSIDFTLTGASGEAVHVGEILTTHTVTITDNETPSTVAFTNASGLVEESNTTSGITIPLTLDPQTQGTGSVTLTLTSGTAVYGTHYTTDPAATGNQVVVPIASGATSASFKVIAIDNNVAAANKILNFEMTAVSGIAVIGTNKTYQLTIEDDDAVTTIADVRAMYGGSNSTIASSLRIQGIVTSSNPEVNANNIWVQDATGGIVVRFTAANNNAIARGDEVSIQLKGGEFTSFSGLLQIQNVDNAKATIISNNNTLPAPEVITIAQFNTGDYEGKLVRVNGVGFVDADGVLTMSGTRAISDGINTTNVRTETAASFATTPMPLGIGTITGLASENGGATQIIPQVFADDVFASSAAGTVTVTQALANFGSVTNGAVSASQSYTVTANSIQKDLVISAPLNFEISTDDITFGSSITFTPADVNGVNKTVYVRFKPATGENQNLQGKINHRALGAVAQSFTVTGTESGNAPIPQLMVENFNLGNTTAADILGLTANWSRHSGTTGPAYATSNLSYTGYPGTSIGGSMSFTNTNSGDVNRKFTAVNATGAVYVSFLVNLSSALATEDYFFHVGPNTIGTVFRGRVFSRTNGAGWSVSLSKSSETNVDDNTVLNFNQTYLMVLKYSFSTAAASDDVVSLYVYDAGIPGAEPGSPLFTISNTGAGTTGDPTDIGSVAVRQGTNTPTGRIDGIRVATNWNDLFN